MSLDAGSVYTVLGGKFNPSAFLSFDNAMRRSIAGAKAFEGRNQKSASTMNMVGKAAKYGAGVGIVGLGAVMYQSVKKAADFEEQLSALEAVTKANGREMGLFRQQAIKAGADTKYSALEAAAAQTELAKGGMSVANIMGGGLKAALGLAAAGDLELAEAAAYTANAMNQFGIAGDKAIHVADVLATAANATTADVSDFGIALSQSGAAADAVGMDIDQTVLALEALAKNGTKGSDAGTSLKTMLTQLANPLGKAAGKAEELGLNFFDAQGNMRPMVEISSMLRRSFGDLTRQERLQAAATLVGQDGMRGLLALYNTGPAKLKRYEAQLALQGTAAETAAKKQDNLKGQVEQLTGSLETAAIILGTELLPLVNEGAGDITEFINQAAGSGDLQAFGADLADGLRDAASVLPAIWAGLQQIAAAGGTAADMIDFVVDALGGIENVAPMLMGAALGLGAFKVAAAVAPGVQTLATAIGLVGTAARTGQLAALPGLFAMSVTPAGAAAAAAMAVGAAVFYMSSQDRSAADIARDLAAAKREQAAAMQTARDQILAAANATFAAQHADEQLADAKKATAAAAREYGKESPQYRDALAAEKEAAFRSTAEHERLRDEKKKMAEEDRKAAEASKKRVDIATEKLKKDIGDAVKMGPGITGPDIIDEAAITKAWKAYNKEIQGAARGTALAKISAIQLARVLEGQPLIANKNAEAVAGLVDVYGHLPKEVKTRVAATAEPALAQIGKLTGQLKGVASRQTIARILTTAPNAQTQIAALTAAVNGMPPRRVMSILHNAKSSQVAVEAFQASVAGVPPRKIVSIMANGALTAQGQVDALRNSIASLSSKTVTITTNQVTTGANKIAKRAAGRRNTSAETALVGEGRDPREYVIDSATGAGYLADGPMFASLGPDDYVVPLDQQYRGRALGLFASLARDLGVEGYKKGKNPKRKGKQPAKGKGKKGLGKNVPKKQDPLRLPVDDVVSMGDKARDRFRDAKRRVGDLERTAKEKDSSGRKTDDAKRAESKLAKARSEANRLKALYEQRRKEAAAAKRYAARIKKQEDQAEIARQAMDNANKTGNLDSWNTNVGKRKQALKHWRRLVAEAQKHVPRNSAYWRELQKALGQIDSDAIDTRQAEFDVDEPEPPEEPKLLTDAEEDRFDQIDAGIALAELTPGIDDDRANLNELLAFREGVLARVRTTGDNELIAQAARDVKSARDQVNGLTDSAPDMAKAAADAEQQLEDLYADFGSNFERAAGNRYFGSGPAADAGGGRQVTIHQSFPRQPDPLTWAKGLEFELAAT